MAPLKAFSPELLQIREGREFKFDQGSKGKLHKVAIKSEKFLANWFFSCLIDFCSERPKLFEVSLIGYLVKKRSEKCVGNQHWNVGGNSVHSLKAMSYEMM